MNAYLGKLTSTSDLDFAGLLEVVSEIASIARIRYTTSHPKEFTSRLIQAYGRLPKLVDHLHLPVQAGSDRVLAAMKRNYTAIEYKAIIRRIREVRPSLSLTSDFIVGFPGETDDDFEKTMQLINELGFDHSFSFVYSPRPGTPAAALTDNTSAAVKHARLMRLQDAIGANVKAFSQAMVGSTQHILVEGFAKNSQTELCGRTSNNRMVIVDLPATHNIEQFIAKLVPVQITSTLAHSLRGTVIPTA